MGCRIGGDSGPGRNGSLLGETSLAVKGNGPVCEEPGAHPFSQRGPLTPRSGGVRGGRLSVSRNPVDSVHQVGIN